MCMGGGGSSPAPPPPPSAEQLAYDKLQRDKALRRQSYLARGMNDPYPEMGTVMLDTGTSTTTGRGTVLGQSEEETSQAVSSRNS